MSAAPEGLPLFRAQALQAQATGLFGAPSLPPDRVGTWVAAAALVLAFALLAALYTVPYARKESVPGHLLPVTGVTEVVAPRAGVVQALGVREGDSVAAGHTLLTVASPRATDGVPDVDRRQIERLVQDRNALRAQLDRETALAQAALDHAAERERTLEAQLTLIGRRLDNADARAGLAERDLDRLLRLDGGRHVAEAALDERRVAVLSVLQEVDALHGERQRLQEQRLAVRAELAQRPLQLQIALAERRLALQEVERAIDEARSRREHRVLAPVSGRVTALTVHAGNAVEAGQSLLAVLPDDTPLQAELLVPPRAIGFVREGQAVRLRYDAFPYQKFGLYPGRVLSVSGTVLLPEQQRGPVRAGVPVYRVLVALDAQTVQAYGDTLPLQPGLTLQADLLRDRRRIVEWLFEPLIAVGRGL